MKKTFIGFLVMLPALVAVAGGSFALSFVTTTSVLSTATQASAEGFIESIYVDVTGSTTGALSIQDSKGYTIFTNAAITADTMFYPRASAQTQAGAAVVGVSNQLEKIYVDGEPLTATLLESGPSSTYVITVRVSR